MAMLELAYGLITQLKTGEFDQLGLKPNDFFIYTDYWLGRTHHRHRHLT